MIESTTNTFKALGGLLVALAAAIVPSFVGRGDVTVALCCGIVACILVQLKLSTPSVIPGEPAPRIDQIISKTKSALDEYEPRDVPKK
jgi:hypothetical protein